METIRELIQRLTTLTPEELSELRAQIVAEAERLDTDEATVDDIALLQELAEFGEQVMAETSNREAAAAQAQADREAARERLRALNPPAEEEQEQQAEEEAPAAEEEQAEEEQETETPPAETPAEPVAASAETATSGGQVARMAARQGTPTPGPEASQTPSPRRPVLTATGALRGLRDPSAPIEDREEFAAAMAETLSRLPRHGSARGDVLLASARWEYPEERRLSDRNSAWENTRIIEAITSPEALLATGGVCLPVNVDYAVPTWASAERPLRDALPGYEATRGGIRYVQPPDIGALAAATGIWTEATDLAPGAATKPLASISCGTELLVYVDAISTRLGFGNMQSRFAPEQVAANTDLAIAAAARIAENNLLNKIAAQCVSGVTTAIALGATRDLLQAVDESVAAYRNLHRIPRSQTITAIFPDWVKDLLRIDLLREIGHDNSGPRDSLAVTDENVAELLRVHGVNPIFHLDGQDVSVSGGVAQTFAAPVTGAIKTFPTKMVWYLFAEGMFQFLDGGRLDLGVVRDSTLDATNDYETFVEVFENIAYRGFTNGALQLVSNLCASGGSAGTQNTQSGTSTACP